MRVGVIGAGAVGRALAALFAGTGHDVVVGSRDRTPGPDGARTSDLTGAAEHGEVVVLAIPFTAAAEVLPPLADRLAGKILVDATNPLGPDWSPLALGEGNSAAAEIAKLAPGAKVAKAFNTVFADMMRSERLERPEGRVTAFIASDDEEAAARAAELAVGAGFDPVRTGPLATAAWLEAMAHLNIAIAVGQGGGTRAAFVYSRDVGS